MGEEWTLSQVKLCLNKWKHSVYNSLRPSVLYVVKIHMYTCAKTEFGSSHLFSIVAFHCEGGEPLW